MTPTARAAHRAHVRAARARAVRAGDIPQPQYASGILPPARPLTDVERRRAALTVAAHARDVKECRRLLDMLGLSGAR